MSKRKNRYLKTGDRIPTDTPPKRHIRSDDGRLILYWDTPEERIFVQAFDSIGNPRVVNGVVVESKRIHTCIICRQERSEKRICIKCSNAYDTKAEWVTELLALTEGGGWQIASLDLLYGKLLYERSLYAAYRTWPPRISKSLQVADRMIEEALREASTSSSFISGIKTSDLMVTSHTKLKKERWNGYQYCLC